MAKIKIQSFLILERALTKRLVSTWRKFSLNLMARIQNAIAKEDWTKVELIIDEINFGRVLTSNKKFMEFIGKGAFLFGVARHGEIKKSKFVKDKTPIPLIKESSENLQKIIAEQGDLFVKQNIRRAVAIIKTRIDESKITKTDKVLVTKAAKVRTNAELMKNAVNGRTNQYLENVSSLHNSRLAGWGYVQEAEALGITTYTVSEQIDSDTICPICISMHGKTFQVSDAKSTLNTRLTVDNLNDLMHIAPFPKGNKASIQSFRNLSNPDLVESGWHVPPYHPRCRGILVQSTDTANIGVIPIKNKRRIPKPAPIPVKEVPLKNIIGLNRFDSDEVRRFFPSLVGDPAKARKALTKKRTTDIFTAAVAQRDAELLARKLRGQTTAMAARIEANYARRAGDLEVVKMIEQLAEDYADSGMNPAILINRPLARLHIGKTDAPKGTSSSAGAYWPNLSDTDKLIYIADFGNVPTLRHEMMHHFDNLYARKDIFVKNTTMFRSVKNLDGPDIPEGLKESVVGMQKEFRSARTKALDELPLPRFGLKKKKLIQYRSGRNNNEFWNQSAVLNESTLDNSKRVTAYQLTNDREWLAEWGKIYYGSADGRAKLKKWYPHTFKLMDDINKGKYLYADDVALAADEAIRDLVKGDKT